MVLLRSKTLVMQSSFLGWKLLALLQESMLIKNIYLRNYHWHGSSACKGSQNSLTKRFAPAKWARGSYGRTFTVLEMIGGLLYLGFTRPDIMYSVHLLSQYIHDPRKAHWSAALHVVCYLKHTPTAGLFFASSSSLQLTTFCAADCVACRDTRRSVTEFCIYLGSTPISWKWKKNKQRSLGLL